jgi:hypothetical protein
MVKGKFDKILLIVALALCVLPLGAQNDAFTSYSPYSMYGIGDVSKFGSAYNKSMGGVGIATRDKRNINILNPAAVTERDIQSFMFDFSITEGNRYYAQKDMHSSNNTFNINSITMSFPIFKPMAMYLGIAPYSDIGYKITAWETDKNIIAHTGSILNTVQGYGGLYNAYIGAGFSLFKGFSVGGEFDYVFGSLHKDNTFEMASSSHRSISSGYTLTLRALTGKFGAQYAFPIAGEVSAVVGATYKLETSLKGTVDRFEIQTISSINDSTPSPRTYSDVLEKGKVKLASEIGTGIALKGGDKWSAEVNYLRSDWTSSGMDKVIGFANVGNAVFSASTSQSVRVGFAYVPNRNDIRYYRRRITYRAGAYWDQAYCKIDGMDLNAVGVTLGATLPVFRWSNGITLGMDFGQRGSKAGNLVRERYVNFHIGINIHDVWFIKTRYD